jgi:hypothetical protein
VDAPGTFAEKPSDYGMFYQWNPPRQSRHSREGAFSCGERQEDAENADTLPCLSVPCEGLVIPAKAGILCDSPVIAKAKPEAIHFTASLIVSCHPPAKAGIPRNSTVIPAKAKPEGRIVIAKAKPEAIHFAASLIVPCLPLAKALFHAENAKKTRSTRTQCHAFLPTANAGIPRNSAVIFHFSFFIFHFPFSILNCLNNDISALLNTGFHKIFLIIRIVFWHTDNTDYTDFHGFFRGSSYNYS